MRVRVALVIVSGLLASASGLAFAQPAQPPPPPPLAPPAAAPQPPPSGQPPVPLPGAPPAAAPPAAAPPAMAPPGMAPPGYPAPQPYPGYPPPYGAYPPGYLPPGYYAPPGFPYYYPQVQALLPPATLAYEDGQSVPSGYRVRSRPHRALVIAGSVIFGSTYLTSVLTAGAVLAGGVDSGKPLAPLFAPGIGPFIAIGTVGGGAGVPLLVLDGLAQLGGLAMLISGVAIEERFLQRVAGGHASPLEVFAHPDLVVGPRSAALRFTM